MVRHKWIVGMRNQLATLAMECDSAAAINGAKMTEAERETLQQKLRDIVDLIDKKLGFV